MTSDPRTRPWPGRADRPSARRGRVSVAGVAGGVGTTTVAAALGAADRGVFVGRAVDVLVCRATGDSLVRAGHAAQLVAEASGRRPVLAVTAADSSGPSRPVTARLRLLEPHTAAVVVLPFVRRWRDLATPLDEARALRAVPHTDLPRPLRRYAAAAHDLLTALSSHTPTSPTPAAGQPAPRQILRRTR